MANQLRSVDFWFDLVSGYSWLAIARAADFAAEHGVQWRLRPFVLGAVLDRIGRRAIAQVESTRGYAVADVARLGRSMGLELNGPPRHPFQSVPALRAHALHQDSERSLPLARELFAAGWERNQDLTDVEVLKRCVAAVDLPTDDLEDALFSAEARTLLRSNTDEAGAAGVFGAPFFFLDGEPFWGHDRMPALAARLGGEPRLPADHPYNLWQPPSESV